MGRADIRQPRWLVPLCFLLPLALYTLTAARTVQGGDTAEFGLLGLFGGVAHPPGYPLFTLLLRAFRSLPIEPPFFRVALASAVCAAGASVVLARLVWRLTADALAAGGTALAFAICPLVWRFAGVPEVFTLHALLTALVLLGSLELSEAKADRFRITAALLGLAFGLGLSNHLTIVLTAPLVLAALIGAGRRLGARPAVGGAAIMGVAVIAGMMPYLLLLRWARLDPTKSSVWGKTTTFRALADHFLRREYGTLRLHGGTQLGSIFSTTYIRELATELPLQLAIVFFVAALLGGPALYRRARGWAWGLAASLLLSGVLFPSLISLPLLPHTLEVAQRFFVLPILLVLPFAGTGLAALAVRFGRRPIAAVAALALLVGGLVQLSRQSWRQDDGIERWIEVALAPLPPHAIVLGEGDTLMPAVRWIQEVRHVRPDVTYIDVGQVVAPWYFERIRQAIPNLSLSQEEVIHPATLAARAALVRPTFVIPILALRIRSDVNVELDGLLDRVTPEAARPDLDRAHAQLVRQSDALEPLPLPADAWSMRIRQEIALAWLDLDDALQKAGRVKEEAEAKQRLQRLLPSSGLLHDSALPGG